MWTLVISLYRTLQYHKYVVNSYLIELYCNRPLTVGSHVNIGDLIISHFTVPLVCVKQRFDRILLREPAFLAIFCEARQHSKFVYISRCQFIIISWSTIWTAIHSISAGIGRPASLTSSFEENEARALELNSPVPHVPSTLPGCWGVNGSMSP